MSTEQRKTSPKIYELILDELNEGVHVVDEHGASIIYNRKMADIESMSKEEVLNKPLLGVFHFPENQDSTLLKALREGKSAKNIKQTYFNDKGKEITTITHTFPIIDEQDQIIGAIEIASDVTKMERVLRDSLEKGQVKYTFDSMIGESPAIMEVIHNAMRASRTSSSVLIIGETGTGKELFAQSIHHASKRSAGPFISQNCAALPDSLIEGLLFGTMKGAFTGAIERPGLFEQAEGGTLFLDEMNSLSLSLQAKLLRALQEKTIRRIGDTKDRSIDARIIAAMNEDPFEAISENRMRKDLFYRLGVVTLFIPPLRERQEDIFLLADHFIRKYNRLFQLNITELDPQVRQFFYTYDWPGNIRELQHIIEGSMNLINEETIIQYSHLPVHHLLRKNKIRKEALTPPPLEPLIEVSYGQTKDLKSQVDAFERYYINKILEKNQGNISKAALELGLSRQSLQYRLRKYKES